jgi:hypothetical protein
MNIDKAYITRMILEHADLCGIEVKVEWTDRPLVTLPNGDRHSCTGLNFAILVIDSYCENSY